METLEPSHTVGRNTKWQNGPSVKGNRLLSLKLGVVEHAFNLSTWGAEAGGSLLVQVGPE